MGFVFQAFNLVPTLTALENVALAGEYAGMKRGQANELAREALGWVGLAERADHRPMELSGGEQQRVAIARSLVNRPALVLADEPTGNLDSAMSTDVLALLRRFNRERGQTVVLVTHDAEVGAVCDRIVRMRDGLIIEEDAPTESRPRPAITPDRRRASRIAATSRSLTPKRRSAWRISSLPSSRSATTTRAAPSRRRSASSASEWARATISRRGFLPSA